MNHLMPVVTVLGVLIGAIQEPVKPTPPNTEKGVAADKAKPAKPLTIPELKRNSKTPRR